MDLSVSFCWVYASPTGVFRITLLLELCSWLYSGRSCTVEISMCSKAVSNTVAETVPMCCCFLHSYIFSVVNFEFIGGSKCKHLQHDWTVNFVFTAKIYIMTLGFGLMVPLWEKKDANIAEKLQKWRSILNYLTIYMYSVLQL